MKKGKLVEHLGLKILAVILAIITWVVVMNIDDYSISKTISDIPVAQINGDSITQLDQLYDVTKGDTVDIIVKGKRSIVERLTAEDFIATADLSQMSITNAVRINVVPAKKSHVNELTILPVDDMLTLTLENKVEKKMPVNVAVFGTEAEGYKVGNVTLNTQVVTLTGAESVISKISEVRVELDVTGLSYNIDTELKTLCYDAYGELINDSKYDISNSVISVNAPIYNVKEVPIRVDLKGITAEGYEVVEVNYQPERIKVAGPQEFLDIYDEIVIDNINISGKTNNIQETIKITDVINPNLIDADVNDSIVINVIIERKKTETITVTTDDIKLINKNDNYEYELLLSDDFSIEVTGLSNNIKDLSVEDLNLRIDCIELEPGVYEQVLNYNESDNYDITFNGTMTFSVIVNEE